MAVKAVLFDFDGTIVDSLKHHHYAWKKSFAATGAHLSDEEIIQKVFYQFSEEKNPKYRVNAKRLELYYQHLEDAFKKLELHEHILKTLDVLKKRDIKLAIISFADSDKIIVELKKLKIDHYFDIILGPNDVSRVKPDPQIAILAMKKLRVRPNETLLVGDTAMDVLTGINAGTKTAFFNPKHNRTYTDLSLFGDSKPDVEFGHFKDLLEKIEKL